MTYHIEHKNLKMRSIFKSLPYFTDYLSHATERSKIWTLVTFNEFLSAGLAAEIFRVCAVIIDLRSKSDFSVHVYLFSHHVGSG